MKAIILILWLSLARGHIFRRQHPRISDILIEPSMYENQLQRHQDKYIVWGNPKPYQQYQWPIEQRGYGHDNTPKEEKERWEWQERKHTEKPWNKEYRKSHHKERSSSDSGSQENSPAFTKDTKYESVYESPLRENEILTSAQPSFDIRSQINPMIEGVESRMAETAPDITWAENDRENITKIYWDAYKSMKSVDNEDKRKFHEALQAAARAGSEDVELNATQLLNKYHYDTEEHVIKTEDGYILTLIRIPPKRILNEAKRSPVVFLMHGLLGSADDWLLMGPEKSLAYLLSDAGYDVWLGNVRGNKYCRHHIWDHPALPEFWRFSNDEISLIDLPAMIDYVLAYTKQEKMYYVGHSQGTTNFFALASSRPEYNTKIIMMYAMSPMAYMTNTRSPALRLLAPISQFEQFYSQLGDGEFNPNEEMIKNQMGGAICEQEIGCRNVCSNAVFTISGVNIEGLDPTLLPVVLSHWPAGTSTKLMKHYAQGIASHGFRKYDYGPEINSNVYGQVQPPRYFLENVTAPVTLYWCEKDWLADPRDVKTLENELPSVKDSYKVPNEWFSHLDFQVSKDAPELIYGRMLDSIKRIQTQLSSVYV